MPVKLKRDASGAVVVVGEKPVIVDENGKESEFDIENTIAAVKERNATIVQMREELRTTSSKLELFAGLEPDKARAALDTVSKMDLKKLVDAGQLDQAVTTLKAEHEKALSAAKAELESVQQKFKSSQIAAAFAGSQFLKEKVANTPVALLQTYFERHFGLDESGAVVGLDGSGKPVYSSNNPSQVAGFDEAIERFIGASPFRDSIITSGQQSGSGTPPNSRGSASGKMTRKQFDDLPPAEKAKRALDTTIVD